MRIVSVSVAITLLYILILILFFCCVLFAGLRHTTGSAYDTWDMGYQAYKGLLDSSSAKSEERKRELEKIKEDINFVTYCLNMYDGTGKLKPEIPQEAQEKAKAEKEKGTPLSKIMDQEVKCIYRTHLALKYDKEHWENKARVLEEVVRDDEKTVSVLQEKFVSFERDGSNFFGLKERYKSRYIGVFVLAPYDLLLQALVMAAGALGGAIRLLRRYEDTEPHQAEAEKSQPSEWQTWIISPFSGMVTALCVYVIIRSGVIALFLSKQEASFNPYVVSLVGFISGLLSKEVLDRIVSAGHEFIYAKNVAGSEKNSPKAAAGDAPQ
jgi:hypothetical protein